jgi:hypothetical protein
MKFYKKFITNLSLIWKGFFYGLSGAEKRINGPTGSADNIEILQQQINGGGVFADMLEEKKTQEVVETVDAYYRVFRESERFDVSSIKIEGEDENGVIFAPLTKLKKKTIADFLQHPPVFNPDNAIIRTIQDNKHLENNYNTSPSMLYNYNTILTINRENFRPRFEIEKLVKKMVVRECEYNKAMVDLYLPAEATQFGKIDAIVISNIYSLMNNNVFKSDLVDAVSFEWVSEKAWNSEDIRLFKYNVIKLIGINKFDGSLVLTYFCDVVENGTDLTEKYKTKELTEKYDNFAAKNNVIDYGALERNIEKKKEPKEEKIDLNNLNKTTFKLD